MTHGQGEDGPEEHGRYVEALMHLTERTGMRGSEYEGALSDDTQSVQSFRNASVTSGNRLAGMRSVSSDSAPSGRPSTVRTMSTFSNASRLDDEATDGSNNILMDRHGPTLTATEIAIATRASSRASVQDLFAELHRERQEAAQPTLAEGASGEASKGLDGAGRDGTVAKDASVSPLSPPDSPPPPPPLTPADLKRRDELIDELDDWSFDMFEVNDLCQGSKPLVFVGFALIMHSKFAQKHSAVATALSSSPLATIHSDESPGGADDPATSAPETIDVGKLRSFLGEVDAGYLDNPYHNNLHGADVGQSVYSIIRTGGMYTTLADWQELGAILSGLVHDLGHFALTNPFLKSTNHPLALTYFYRSPLESMHLAKAFEILAKPQCDFLSGLLPGAELAQMRNLMVDMVREGVGA